MHTNLSFFATTVKLDSTATLWFLTTVKLAATVLTAWYGWSAIHGQTVDEHGTLNSEGKRARKRVLWSAIVAVTSLAAETCLSGQQRKEDAESRQKADALQAAAIQQTRSVADSLRSLRVVAFQAARLAYPLSNPALAVGFVYDLTTRDPELREAAEQVKDQVRELYDSVASAALDPTRVHRSGQDIYLYPPCDTVPVHQQAPPGAPILPGCQLRGIPIQYHTTRRELTAFGGRVRVFGRPSGLYQSPSIDSIRIEDCLFFGWKYGRCSDWLPKYSVMRYVNVSLRFWRERPTPLGIFREDELDLSPESPLVGDTSVPAADTSRAHAEYSPQPHITVHLDFIHRTMTQEAFLPNLKRGFQSGLVTSLLDLPGTTVTLWVSPRSTRDGCAWPRRVTRFRIELEGGREVLIPPHTLEFEPPETCPDAELNHRFRRRDIERQPGEFRDLLPEAGPVEH